MFFELFEEHLDLPSLEGECRANESNDGHFVRFEGFVRADDAQTIDKAKR